VVQNVCIVKKYPQQGHIPSKFVGFYLLQVFCDLNVTLLVIVFLWNLICLALHNIFIGGMMYNVYCRVHHGISLHTLAHMNFHSLYTQYYYLDLISSWVTCAAPDQNNIEAQQSRYQIAQANTHIQRHVNNVGVRWSPPLLALLFIPFQHLWFIQ
jgi:hypothetical protein